MVGMPVPGRLNDLVPKVVVPAVDADVIELDGRGGNRGRRFIGFIGRQILPQPMSGRLANDDFAIRPDIKKGVPLRRYAITIKGF